MKINGAGRTPSVNGGAGPSKWPVAAGVVVAVIVVLGLVLALTNVLGGTTESAPPATVPTPSDAGTATATSSPTTVGAASVCGLTNVQVSGTVTTAPAATWALVGTIAAPSIEGQGPGKIDEDGYRSCYARTPTGALLAAANYSAIGSNGTLRAKFYEQATVPGPGRDALLQQPVPGAGATGTRVQVAGYRVLRYDGTQADIDVAVRTANGAIGALVLNLQWSGGDWKLRLADDGTELSAIAQIPSLAGYTPWSGA